MTVGERIRAARKAKGLTQKQLGEACGIAEPTIRRYELGKLNPKYETLQKIAKPLGLEAWQLLPGKEFADFFAADQRLFDPIPPTREEMARGLQELHRLETGERQTADFSDVPPEHRKKLGQILDFLEAALRLDNPSRALVSAYAKEKDKQEREEKEALYAELIRLVAPLSSDALERVVQVVKLFVEKSLGVSLTAPEAEKKDSEEK